MLLTPAEAQALAQPYVPGFGCRDDDPLQAALNDLYDYRDDLETKVLHRSRLNLFHELMTRLIARGAFHGFERALDLGCNAGYYSKMLSDFGFADVVGVDIEPEFVERARAAFASDAPGRRRTFHVANAEEIDEPAGYDFILCTEVIEHTTRPDRVITNLAAALRRGGIAVVTLPNRDSIPYAWARLVHALRRRPYDAVLRDHLSWPSSRAVRLFQPHGLERVETAGTNLALAGPAIRTLYGKPGFALLHRLNGAACRVGPLQRYAQFFFVVWRKP